MKKHLIYSINVLFALIIILTINSCRKETPNLETKLSVKSLDLISEAKLHFDNSIKEAPSDRDLSGNEEKNKFQLLSKKVLWDYAKVKKMAVGESVRVPIFYDEENFIKAGKDKKAMSLYNLSYLMMYKDKKGKMQTEWVITIPDNDYVDRKRNSGVKFTGVIHVLDWKGNLIKSYSYHKDGSVMMGKEMTFSKKNNLKVASNQESIKLNDYWISGCYTNYFWTCGSSGGTEYCHDYYSVTTCYNIRVVEPAGKELPVSEGGSGGGPSDYIPEDTECPVSGNPENPGDQPPLIGERSISTNNTNCDGVKSLSDVTNNVVNPCLKDVINQLNNSNDLSSLVNIILKNTFGVNDQINVTFSESNLNSSTAANTSGSQLNNMDIVFNSQLFTQNNLPSKEFLTETAMHEVFHAYLFVNPSIRGQLSQHLFMAQNYINNEVSALRNIYPNLSKSDAEKLVIAGYGELQASDPNAFNQILNLYNYTAFDVQTTNSNYNQD